ncbi:PHP domain-containing protein [Jatrophihabitans sp. YIM 134969]
MGHHHHDGFSHTHDHEGTHEHLDPAKDLSIPDDALDPGTLGRRGFMRSAGLLGAGVAAVGVMGANGVFSAPAAAQTTQAARRALQGGFRWLAGDHHIHTQYSSDAQYRVVDQVQHAAAYGLDWMVITDHGSDQHTRIGVDKVNPDILAARSLFSSDTLVFQGLEWNIPAAEHGTVFVHPGANEVAVLKQFEATYDAANNGAGASTPANETVAITGLNFLAKQVSNGKVLDALMLANHPSRKGIDSPHEIRGWRDAQPRIAIGFEGAPGHQAAGIPAPVGPGSARGYYDFAPDPANSFPGYPMETYRTFGGFDWMTATVGGLWDSLLSEGKAWWITANSDSHQVYADISQRGPNDDFTTNGVHADPVHGPLNTTFGDFWPGYYSRTHVGATGFNYKAVMDGLRAGRVWVDHGGLLDNVNVRLVGGGQSVPLGGVLAVPRGTAISLVIDIQPARTPNWSQFVPQLAKLDIIQGLVTGKARDKDTFSAPNTKVLKSWDLSGNGTDRIQITQGLGRVGDQGLYVRLRGSDGNRTAPGLNGAAVDAAGPAMDVVGDADPWNDLWFYTNPMWALPTSSS